MKFFISQVFSIEIEKKANIPMVISDYLSKYFDSKNYGSDLIEMGINLICVSPGFDQFFVPKKPKYIKDKKTRKSIYTQNDYTIEMYFTYDIKIDFETFKNATESDAEKILAREILSSLNTLDSIRKKIKDFDWYAFKRDLENYFREKGFI